MMLPLTKKEGIPHYVKIREALREEIKAGGLKRGQKLPSEEELAIKYGVSRMTVRQGLADLIDDGLVYRRQGVGTFVALPHVQRDHSRLSSFFETAASNGVTVRTRLLALEVFPARQRVANALDFAEGELVIRVKTLRYADELPVTVHDAYVPHALFARILNEDLERQHLWTLYEQCGYRVKRAVQNLEAREADEELAYLLEILEGAPILFKERTVYADDGMPIEFTYCYNRGDRYTLTVTLER